MKNRNEFGIIGRSTVTNHDKQNTELKLKEEQ